MVREIYGQIRSGSSKSVDLTESLGNRLKVLSATAGSTVYPQTWKRRRTPLGRLYWAHTVQVRHTSDNDFGGWHTPDTLPDMPNTNSNCKNVSAGLGNQAQAAGWATPRHGKVTDEDPETWAKRNAKGDVSTMPLTTQAQMAGWATPRTPTGGPESAERKQELGRTDSGGSDLQAQAQAAGWQTARAVDGSNPPMGKGRTDSLPSQVKHNVSPPVNDGRKSHGLEIASDTTQKQENSETSVQSVDSTTETNVNAPGQPTTDTSMNFSEERSMLAGWPTCSQRDYKGAPQSRLTPETTKARLDETAMFAGWPTPNTTNNGSGEEPDAKEKRGMNPGLNPADAARLAGWPTVSANEDAAGKEGSNMREMLSHTALTCGSEDNGTTAVTEKHGGFRLNPGFSLWLMLGPQRASEWLRCVGLAMRST